MSERNLALGGGGQRQLWSRLETFEVGEVDTGLTFTDRLARENG